ncbi:u3 small nucleolar ribonucleoprotein MPP10 [Coemansia sp. RSA 1199]|nr:u3 small nucleolar ribonucleoprotein MPP10 [Coemansia sp. RSA 1199]
MGKRRSAGNKADKTVTEMVADTFAQTVPDSFIEKFIDSPDAFIVPTAEARDAAMDVVSRTYDAANTTEKFGLFDDWKAVMTSGFDPDMQLWELINIRNEPVLKNTADVMKELSLLLDSVSDNESESESDSPDAMDVSDDQVVDSDIEASESAGDSDEGSDLESGAESDKQQADDTDESEDDDEEDEEEEERSTKPSIVDDEFFSLAEMEAFADKAEQEEMRDRAILAGNYPKQAEEDGESSDDDDESIDLFQDHGAMDDDDEDEDDDDDDSVMGGKRVDELMYADFYKPPSNSKRGKAKAALEKHAKRVKFDPSVMDSDNASDLDDNIESETEPAATKRTSNLFDDDDDEDNSGAVNDGKSDFERRQEKLQGLIGKLEDEAVAGKHWTMTGEVGSTVRPQNSLLAEDLDFDHMQKPVPVVTQEATLTLEDVIKRRILNEEWDDVERKKDIQAKPFKPSEFIELNDKQSKKSLAEEYESEYMAQKAGEAFVPENDAKLTESHRDVDSQMRNLFTQLDALSHFHFAPRPAAVDIEIRTNTPALQMEEKLPVSMTQADQLAPSEIFDKRQRGAGRTGDIVGDTELSREERKLRRQRKKGEKKKQAAAKASVSKPKPTVKSAS